MNGRFVLRRVLQVVPTVLGIVLVGFLLIHLAPGDPIVALAGEHGDEAYYAFMRRRFGLDEPVLRQLSTYFLRVASGDFGSSFVYGRSAAQVIVEHAPATLLLTGTALVVAVLVAIPIGALAAGKPNSVRDLGINTAALGLYSAPEFWIGQLALLVLALRLGLFPVQGMTDAGSSETGWSGIGEVLRHLALPALVLATHEVAVLVRLARTGLIAELARDHIRTARAKGVAERSVWIRHAFPRALLPTITVIGARIGHLIGGAVVVEIVFGWPGMGRVLLAALSTRDIPILLGLFFTVAFTVVLVNLVTDLVYAALDPRLRLR